MDRVVERRHDGCEDSIKCRHGGCEELFKIPKLKWMTDDSHGIQADWLL